MNDKSDDPIASTANLRTKHVVFVENERTGDYNMTIGLLRILENEGKVDDVDAFLEDKLLPLDEFHRRLLAEEIFQNPPESGYLTISTELQLKSQHTRFIEKSRSIVGTTRVF